MIFPLLKISREVYNKCRIFKNIYILSLVLMRERESQRERERDFLTAQ